MKKVKASHEELFTLIANNIMKQGRAVIGVQSSGKQHGFSYTIGNQEKLLPELLCIGNFDPVIISTMLNSMSDKMLDEKAPLLEGEYWGLNGKYPLMIYETGSLAKAKYTIQAGQFYNNEDYQVLQIVLPDSKGKWPSDPLCHKAFKVPVLMP